MSHPSVGAAAPEFELRGPGGSRVSLSEFRGRKPIVLAFYPLAFSPVCSHQLPELQKHLARIRERGAEVFGVSVDSHWANRAFAESLGLGFDLLSDWDHAASQAYGVYLPARRYSNRALFLIDKDGTVAHADVMPHPGEIPPNDPLLEALERLG